ncbi:uncharacterized protein LOC118646310 isoform X3 [Monomorium pharaonis]|uniref:uncharacterized protein LOC118646310 isoform X3 n=1 Tax=Monomorium pharaonis TaxID=307658 RepID=UPI001746198A|nr:uncharacterized protein LOC118646310 isoform X3 [Monomorium pharaonis]
MPITNGNLTTTTAERTANHQTMGLDYQKDHQTTTKQYQLVKIDKAEVGWLTSQRREEGGVP